MKSLAASSFIKCLECGREFKSLGSHISRIHRLSARDYKVRHDLPQSFPLAIETLVEAQSRFAREMIAKGVLVTDREAAINAARKSARPPRCKKDSEKQREIAARMGSANRKLPPGAKGPRGKDMDKARENLRNWRRAAKKRQEEHA